jgi:uncharacterized metal-binding protein
MASGMGDESCTLLSLLGFCRSYDVLFGFETSAPTLALVDGSCDCGGSLNWSAIGP